ncbi:MAG: hypothetical protein KGN36_19090 [Acidobacteriota bacterium]|nr:hypothetical protein [Acidobacteriota bacterium]
MTLLTASAVALAQTQTGGAWRRAEDPAPPAAQQQPAPEAPTAPESAEPTARADEYGQPQTQPQAPPQAPPAARRPPSPLPRYGLPSQVTVPAGTFVTVRVNQTLSSDRNQQGDFFSASLAQPVVVNGVVVAQRGQTVTGRVAEAVKARAGKGVSHLGLQLTALTLADGTQANVQSQLVTRNGTTTPAGQQAATVGTAAAVGATVGTMADWGRGALIGGGVGAAAGMIGVMLTRGHPTVVEPETPLTFRVETPITVDIARAPQAYRFVGPNEYDHPVDAQLARRPQQRRTTVYAPYPYPDPYMWGSPYGWGYPYPYYGGVMLGGGWGGWGGWGGGWGRWRRW